MADHGDGIEAALSPKPVTAKAGKKGGKFSWRGLIRAIHRDAGHLSVGLTLVYAISGIAVNHILDWEPNFESYQQIHELGEPIVGTDDEVAASVIARLDVKGTTRDIYRAAPDDLQIILDKRTLHVNTQNGRVLDEGQKPRFFLRVSNWLHLNRGKKAWTYFADAYAGSLILLALSGILITPGRRGVFGRGGLLILVGAAAPLLYVQLSGGPEHQSNRPELAAPAGK